MYAGSALRCQVLQQACNVDSNGPRRVSDGVPMIWDGGTTKMESLYLAAVERLESRNKEKKKRRLTLAPFAEVAVRLLLWHHGVPTGFRRDPHRMSLKCLSPFHS